MQTKTRMNVYFEPELLKKVEALALRRRVSKSAVIEAAVASFLSAWPRILDDAAGQEGSA